MSKELSPNFTSATEAFDLPECPSTRGNVQRLNFDFTRNVTHATLSLLEKRDA